MACELFLLSSLWFLFLIFWMETISLWLFLCNFYQDRTFYQWGERVLVSDPGHLLYIFVSSAGPSRPPSCSPHSSWGRRAHGWSPAGWRTRGQRWEAPAAAPAALRTQPGPVLNRGR
ncbi:uncharacterized protein ACDP82_020030 isoform 1-T3 [Pangshura tecta]